MPGSALRSNVTRGSVTPFVSALVVFHGLLALFSSRDAGAYPLVFQRVSEPVGIVASIPEQPSDLWQTAQQCPCAHIVIDLSGGDEEVERSSLAIANGVKLGVHTTCGPANQATAPPFLTPKLDAVRWALR